MYQVSRIEKLSSGRYQVVLEDGTSFPLYWKDLKAYQVEEGAVLADQNYQAIMQEVLPLQAKRRALHLLERMDRTEQQLRKKLEEGQYPEEVIDMTVSYLRNCHYLDDQRYAKTYLEYRKAGKSLRQMERELYQKGISREDFQCAARELEGVDEDAQIRCWMEKKRFVPEEADRKETERFVNFLMRRGYTYSQIRKVMQQ